MKINVYLLDALDTVLDGDKPRCDTLKYAKMLRNEAFSFELAVLVSQTESDGLWDDKMELRVTVESEIKDMISVYTLENVPCTRIGYKLSDDWFISKKSGIYPDRLEKRKNNDFTAPIGHARSVFFTLNEEKSDLDPGKYPVTVKVFRRDRHERSEHEKITLVAEKSFDIEVIDAMLPKQSIMTTNWIHYDCIAHFSGTKPFSEGFFKTVREVIRTAVINGQNMVLLPAFTPPLDTPIGAERMTVQLVKVTKENGRYVFDFSLLDKFVRMCLECGVEYFEHSHLFTQWGAKHAPKIIVREKGKSVKMFGWKTDSRSEEYKTFLTAYITELKKYIAENGLDGKFFFHISDEPNTSDLESYGDVSGFMHGLLGDLPSGDALADYELYENGYVKTPIVATDRMDDFLGRSDNIWAYYTGMQSMDNLSNRLIGMPQERGRILGTVLYYYGIKGFLNWGFNAWHNRLARKMIDPRVSSDMDEDFVSGTSYIVYPNGKGVDMSVRLVTFRDSMQDAGVLALLESMTDRENVLGIIRKHIPDIGFNCRVSKAQLLGLRDEVNRRISEEL